MILEFSLHDARPYVRVSQIFAAVIARYPAPLRIESMKCVREITGRASLHEGIVLGAACVVVGKSEGKPFALSLVAELGDVSRCPAPDLWSVEILECDGHESTAELRNINGPADLFAAAIEANKRVLEGAGARDVRFGSLKGMDVTDARGTVAAFIDHKGLKRVGAKTHAFGSTAIVGACAFDVAFSFH